MENHHLPSNISEVLLLSDRGKWVGKTPQPLWHSCLSSPVTAPLTILFINEKEAEKIHSTQTTPAGLSFTIKKYFLVKTYYNYYNLRSEFLFRSLSFFIKFLYNWTSPIHFQGFRIKDRSALYREISFQ